jgi:single-strand DNA-binding protein
MSRSLNKVQLIGNLTRDPELRYTPQGTAVCNFGIATNRQWTTDSGEKKEDVEFHRIVAWNKLAELCAQLLSKGRKVFVEGRLQTRQWQTNEGQDRQTTEIVIRDMIILDSRYQSAGEGESMDNFDIPEEDIEAEEGEKDKGKKSKKTTKKKSKKKDKKKKTSKKGKKKTKKGKDDDSDDIPF